ncbi:MAG: hypothetical protein A3I61_14225 [Acidobacteria bacterium RIFCSPLOWO2_02_FULL_68_18]|nr:MAG: hypothetical protein A3I61_14225 [Acidobacteria bacterium RIFCSPLOWO2_02_FULL_68_18]OFW49993.1 MAG: hypothetical protein A3G77_08735 [Acidobacteria bacterium RIFCSPLOWO2_12_FULL_68_19]
MNVWQEWLRKPRTVLLRKVAFQLHLWIGLATGLYVLMLSVTGSALVFRREMDRAARPQGPPLEQSRPVLPKEELARRALRAYPGSTVERVGDPQRRMALVRVALSRDGRQIERDFNAYTGEDLGPPWPWQAEAVLKLAELHDDLLLVDDRRGRSWNGIGSILVTVLCLTGLVLWWRGLKVWPRGLTFTWRAAWPRFNFDAHSALGFWFFTILMIWAVTGIYMAFPDPFTRAVDWYWGPIDTFEQERTGDVLIRWAVRLHFGRWRSHTLKAVWVVLGLLPAVMLVTGAAMWWRRVVVPRRRAAEAPRAADRVMALGREPQQVE